MLFFNIFGSTRKQQWDKTELEIDDRQHDNIVNVQFESSAEKQQSSSDIINVVKLASIPGLESQQGFQPGIIAY